MKLFSETLSGSVVAAWRPPSPPGSRRPPGRLEDSKLHSTFGRHLLAEYHGCTASILDDVVRVRAIMEHAAEAASATIVQTVTHRFTPHGVSVVIVLEESHLSIHTWPESGYAAVDFYTCGDCDPCDAHDVLLVGLGAEFAELSLAHRGLRTEDNSIQHVRQWMENGPVEIAGRKLGRVS